MDDADERKETVDITVDDRDGLKLGWPVLQRYLSILKWQEDMIFIQEGDRGGFFIDYREVSASEFIGFCNEQNWRQPTGARSGQHPIVNITYYDALMYLSTRNQSKKLPTK